MRTFSIRSLINMHKSDLFWFRSGRVSFPPSFHFCSKQRWNHSAVATYTCMRVAVTWGNPLQGTSGTPTGPAVILLCFSVLKQQPNLGWSGLAQAPCSIDGLLKWTQLNCFWCFLFLFIYFSFLLPSSSGTLLSDLFLFQTVVLSKRKIWVFFH